MPGQFVIEIVPPTPKLLSKTFRKARMSNNFVNVNHTRAVLKLINEGSYKEIMQLRTIGKEGASSIYWFRHIKGRLRQISDLDDDDMHWRGNGYQRFLQANFLVPTSWFLPEIQPPQNPVQ